MEGSAEQLRGRVLVEIRVRGGATCDEVECALGLRHQTASARICELSEEGRVADSGERRLTRSGRKAVVWREVSGVRLPEPPLKWAGKKTWLLPTLREMYERCRPARLVEPFVGSAAVALGLNPSDALLRDANLALINFYLYLQTGPTFSLAMQNDESFFYAARERLNTLIMRATGWGTDDADEAAELFYYLNRTCFNGLCRFNKTGGFNVPFGRYKKINYRRDFTEYKVAFANFVFEQREFSVVEAFRPGDFLFLDPPYDCEFVDYSGGGFTWEQQVQVAMFGASHSGPVVATNACTSRILNLYTNYGYKVRLAAAPRSIAANGDRGAAIEMIATKNI